VVLSFARRDERGSPQRPSRWTEAFCRAHSTVHRVEPASGLHAHAHRVTVLGTLSAQAAHNVGVEAERREYFLDPRLPARAHSGLASSLDLLVGGDSVRPIAVTLLETYERCPFLAFAAGVVRAVRDEAAQEAIGARERGSLIHAALAEALTVVGPLIGSLPAPELEARALAVATAHIEAQTASPLRLAGFRSALLDVAALLRWSLAEGSPYVFREAERPFGRGADWGPLELDGVHFAGRIDRIDADRDTQRFRIIDYKAKPPTAKAREQSLLQPWLYADRVAAEHGTDDVESGYLALRGRQPVWTVARRGTENAELAAAARERALRAARALRDGRVDPRPDNAKSCQRCDARPLCRRPLSAPTGEDDES
jgi:RecB family exonuclease